MLRHETMAQWHESMVGAVGDDTADVLSIAPITNAASVVYHLCNNFTNDACVQYRKLNGVSTLAPPLDPL